MIARGYSFIDSCNKNLWTPYYALGLQVINKNQHHFCPHVTYHLDWETEISEIITDRSKLATAVSDITTMTS